MRILRLLPFLLIFAFVLGSTANAAAPPTRVDFPYAMVLRVLDESAGQYQVDIENGNPTRFVSAFNWVPPAGMTVKAITSTSGGVCHLDGNGNIVCKGLGAPPDSDTSIGGSIKVNFTATGKQPTWTGSYWIHYGVVGTVSVQFSKFSDLPQCKSGQQNTKAHPCANI
jgi:hypothetical protein